MIAGYAGGLADRFLMSINDTFIVIRCFPSWCCLLRHARPHVLDPAGIAHGLPRLGLRCPPDPLPRAQPAPREFTETAIFSGMTVRQVLLREHLPFVLPIVFSLP